jgi:hypothetical protein
VQIECLTLILTSFLAPVLPQNAVQSKIADAFNEVRVSSPKVQWDAKSAVMADITGDGISDVIVVGYDEKSVWLALVAGIKGSKLAKPIIQQFSIGQSQSSFCARPVHVDVYPPDCEGNAGPLPGCKAVKGAAQFSLEDGACDSFHFYWDRDRRALRWWRN